MARERRRACYSCAIMKKCNECIDHDSDDEQQRHNRDDTIDSKQMKDQKKMQETDSDRKQTWTGIHRQR